MTAAAIVGMMLVPTVVTATLPHMKEFKALCPAVPKASALDKAGCKACHTTGAKLNPFGTDMSKVKVALKSKAVTANVLKKLEALDSDKDGVKNAAEVKKGTLPGDATSK